jgi:hypothetical protein
MFLIPNKLDYTNVRTTITQCSSQEHRGGNNIFSGQTLNITREEEKWRKLGGLTSCSNTKKKKGSN